jgi:hypothetical protein
MKVERISEENGEQSKMEVGGREEMGSSHIKE